MAKARKFADGGDIEYSGTDEDAMATAKARIAQKDAEYAARRAAEETPAPKPKRSVRRPSLADEEALGERNIAAIKSKATSSSGLPKAVEDFRAAGKPNSTKRKGFYDDANTALVDGAKSLGSSIMSKLRGWGDDAKRPARSSSGNSFKPIGTSDTQSTFKKGGSVKGWGKARGARTCKIV